MARRKKKTQMNTYNLRPGRQRAMRKLSEELQEIRRRVRHERTYGVPRGK